MVTERVRASSGSPFEKTIGFSRALRVSARVIVSGTAPVWPDGSCPDDVAVQATRCLDIITTALIDVGASIDDVVCTRIYLVDVNDAATVGAVHGERFSTI